MYTELNTCGLHAVRLTVWGRREERKDRAQHMLCSSVLASRRITLAVRGQYSSVLPCLPAR